MSKISLLDSLLQGTIILHAVCVGHKTYLELFVQSCLKPLFSMRLLIRNCDFQAFSVLTSHLLFFFYSRSEGKVFTLRNCKAQGGFLKFLCSLVFTINRRQ